MYLRREYEAKRNTSALQEASAPTQFVEKAPQKETVTETTTKELVGETLGPLVSGLSEGCTEGVLVLGETLGVKLG